MLNEEKLAIAVESCDARLKASTGDQHQDVYELVRDLEHKYCDQCDCFYVTFYESFLVH